MSVSHNQPDLNQTGSIRLMPEPGLDTFAAWLDAEHVSPNTRRAYLRWAGEYLQWLPDITPAGDPLADPKAATWAARDWRMHLLVDRALAPASVAQALGAIAAFYRSLELPRPDVKGTVPTLQFPKALTDEQLVAVLRGAEARGPRDHALVHVGLHGLRISELCALDTVDVTYTDQALRIRVRYGKGGQPRTVPLEPTATTVLRRWMRDRATRHGQDGPLWTRSDGGRLSVRAARTAITKAGETAGVRVHPHMLRHTFLTRLARRGEDEALMADLAGHRGTSTLRVYTRSNEHDRARAVAGLTVAY